MRGRLASSLARRRALDPCRPGVVCRCTGRICVYIRRPRYRYHARRRLSGLGWAEGYWPGAGESERVLGRCALAAWAIRMPVCVIRGGVVQCGVVRGWCVGVRPGPGRAGDPVPVTPCRCGPQGAPARPDRRDLRARPASSEASARWARRVSAYRTPLHTTSICRGAGRW